MSALAESSISYDAALPISSRVEDIAETISNHQVVVVAGETGSGKTTQLPKICLQLGRGSIAHTQPRRIAARTTAERVAEELGVSLGDLVGYQVRFTRQAGRDTQLKVMTDGVLLAEIGRDRDLLRYDTIILDEAHERSLNIDFLLGYLKRLLTRRRDLKVIITSATIDTQRFADHFAAADGDPAPIIEVSGRNYPVETRYRPLVGRAGADGDEQQDDLDQVDGICRAVQELISTGGDGDILVFLSGEREIRDTADALAKAQQSWLAQQLRFTEILPLYARLSATEQHRVFTAHTGRRIILATNVAETSLTVPGIRYVIDAGTARISRYSARTKVQRLPIEPISKASADQRAGRCGRVAPGICIRLYDEEDYAGRPDFTEPEILRTNLASVILQMSAAGLGDIASFPFVEAPDAAQINDGLRLLQELGAIQTAKAARSRHRSRDDRGPKLTRVGRKLANIPVDPRLARMMLAGERQGCLHEILVIVSALSVQDPRERSTEHRDAADALHRRFWTPIEGARPELAGRDGFDNERHGSESSRSSRPESVDGPVAGPSGRSPSTGSGRHKTGSGRGDSGSGPSRSDSGSDTSDSGDFIALLRLWDYLRQQQRALSGNGFRRMCRAECLHFLRIREWQDLHGQLTRIARDIKLSRNDQPAGQDSIHTAILTGLLSHVGLAEVNTDRNQQHNRGRKRRRSSGPREYLGARGTRFAINPGSSLAKINPPLVMAAEITETTRLWARTVAPVDASQVERVGGHLLKHTYTEPHWSARNAAVMAYEQVSLYGIPIIAGRRVSYGKVDPGEAREIFIRSALVEGDWRTRHPFFAENQQVWAEAEELEERTRRRDLVVDDQVIFDFYDARVPADITSGAHFDRWWKTAREQDPNLLQLTLDDLVADPAAANSQQFPDHLTVAGIDWRIDYTFDPSSNRDGVTVEIPISQLNQADESGFSWQVPGLRLELATELIRSLPKAIRRSFVPAPEHASRALTWLAENPGPTDESFTHALGRAVRSLTGQIVPADAWYSTPPPAHVLPNYLIIDGQDRERPQGSGEALAEGKNLTELKRRLAPRLATALNQSADEVTRRGATEWIFDTIAEQVETHSSGGLVLCYPGLADEGTTVGLRAFDAPARRDHEHARGLRRLILINTPDPTRWVTGRLSRSDKLTLAGSPYPDLSALLADARLATADMQIRRSGLDPVRDEKTFTRLRELVRTDMADRMLAVVADAAAVLREWQRAWAELDSLDTIDAAAAADLTDQLENLIFPGFLGVTDAERLPDLTRYMQAALRRIRVLRTNPAKDAAGLATMTRVEDAYGRLCGQLPAGPLPPDVDDIGWMLEELRVSLFAQSLRTRYPVSEKRVLAAIADARRVHALAE